MMPRLRWPIFIIILFLLSLSLSRFLDKGLQLKKGKIFYVPPYSYINTISGSFRFILAEIFYVRGIISVAEAEPESLDYVLDNFRLATKLDYRMTSAYVLGGIVAPRGREEIPKGIQFLKEVALRNPLEWRIPFWTAFNYFQLGDYLKAGKYYQKAALLPNAPRYLRGLATWSYYNAGKADLAVPFLEGLRDSLKDPALLQQLERKIEWVKNIVFLEEKVLEFKNSFNHWPKDLDELVDKRLIKEIPKDPFGKGYYLDDRWYDQRYAGKVKSKL